MAAYEYTVVPAPTKGTKAKGVKTPEARFALALQELMNEMGAEGWEYQRAETLPSVERSGLTGSTTNWRHVLVFRRSTEPEVAQALEFAHEPDSKPEPIPAPSVAAPVVAAPVAATVAPQLAPEPDLVPEDHDVDHSDDHPGGQPGATSMFQDDGVEEISDVAGVTTSLETLAETRRNSENSDV